MLSTQELLSSPPLAADVLFIGMPTRLGTEHLAKVRFQKAVLFDYQDGAGPTWHDSDRDLLLSITNRYLKPWVEASWDYGLRMGVLPIRRHFRLTACLRCRDAFSRVLRNGTNGHRYDVAFVGSPSTSQGRPHQRFQWVREIKGAGNRYSFWGGIVAKKPERERLNRKYDDITDLYYSKDRVGFVTYLRHLTRSRVALAPAGAARWSYRHYEAIYARAVLVSSDFHQADTLIPLPKETMVHVPDGASVLPAIDKALAMREQRPHLPEENVRFLERYLHYGDYFREKPELMDRFLAQLG